MSLTHKTSTIKVFHIVTQKEIKNKCKFILGSIPNNEYVENSEDFKFLLEAFALCPYYEMKTKGQRIVRIQKRSSGSYNTSCFFLIREDGTMTDISYSKMFRKNPMLDDLLSALRYAIDPIISNFRKNFVPFEYEGTIYDNIDAVDVDHYNLKFKELASIWIDANGGVEHLSRFINKVEDNNPITCLVDEALVADFIQFHNRNTHLRFLPRKINQKLH